MNYRLTSLLLFGLMLAAAPALAQDLSDDINNPTVFNIGPTGATFNISNSVVESDLSTGVTGNAAADIDFFNVVVASGFQLDSITLTSFSGGGDAFFGFDSPALAGNPAIAAQQAAFAGSAIGFTLIDGSESSLFSEFALGAQGTLPLTANVLDPNQPLAAGTYAFVFQNTGTNVNEFALTFTGSEVAVPEPSSAIAIIALGLTMVTRRRRS